MVLINGYFVFASILYGRDKPSSWQWNWMTAFVSNTGTITYIIFRHNNTYSSSYRYRFQWTSRDFNIELHDSNFYCSKHSFLKNETR